MDNSLGWTLALVGVVATQPLSAQLDYRNLDDDRPVRVEDAQPVETYAFELLLPYGAHGEKGGGVIHSLVPELAYGLAPNLHVGVKVPLALVRHGPGTEVGVSGVRAFALYNLNTEFGWVPAVALRLDGELPIGGFAASTSRVALKGIATRAFGAHRVHANAAYRIGSGGTPGLVESLPRWWAGVAVDRTLYRESLLLVAEGRVERATDRAPLDVAIGGGVRWQWTPTAVLDVGVSRGLRSGVGHEIEVSIGVSHVFAVRALVPGAR